MEESELQFWWKNVTTISGYSISSQCVVKTFYFMPLPVTAGILFFISCAAKDCKAFLQTAI